MIDAFARLLYETIGLDASSIGLSSVERAVQQRVAATKSADAQAYFDFLRTTSGETQALVEAIVVPETWFFRDPKAFSVVAEQALGAPLDRQLRFLCIPCSTGEEPYSLAMALLDAHLPASRFQIDAMDVSERVILHARRGIYGRNSFRGQDLAFRDRHFQQTPEGWHLNPAVRQCVQFHHGNLLDDASMARGRTYDAIFCRNLLIYFDAPTQHRAIVALERLLSPQGLFCVGPAETGMLAPHAFTHTRIPLAFAFRRGRPAPPAAPVRALKVLPATAPAVKKLPPVAKKPVPVVLPPPPAPAASGQDLAEATRLADEGRFGEVTTLCQRFLKESGASAQAYYLLGLVSDASGRLDEAANFYRKALYLEPQHHDTLLHYSLLTAKRGDANAALALRERARRATGKAA